MVGKHIHNHTLLTETYMNTTKPHATIGFTQGQEIYDHLQKFLAINAADNL